MELQISTKSPKIAEVISDTIVIQNTQDALDLMATASFQGARCLIFHEHHLSADFFQLHTQLAGDILQKYAQYQMRVAIIGDFKKFESKSLHAFIVESNRGKQAFFVPDRATAITKLTSK